MCGICGCGNQEVGLESEFHHHHDERLISLEKDILETNLSYAKQNRDFFSGRQIKTINLLSSPGSGKTTLLEKTILQCRADISIAVIEGDQHTDRDAQRILKAGAKVKQINTGKICHLDAHMIHHVLDEMQLENNSLLFIENVGNLVCPALFDLGEHYKVVVCSVTEGDDKPLKYALMFRSADLVVINKIDLLPYVDFDVEQCMQYIKEINPRAKIITLSAKSAENLPAWQDWLLNETTAT